MARKPMDQLIQEGAGAETLAARVRHLVELHHGSVLAAAEASGISQPTLHRVATGTTPRPGTDVLQRLAAEYDVSIDWLLTGKGRGPRYSFGPIPQAESKRWDKLIRSLDLPQETLSALASLPRATSNASLNLPLELGDEMIQSVLRYELLAWAELLEAWIKVFGKEKTSEVLTRYTAEIARGFRTPARVGGLAEPPVPRKPRRGK